MHSYTGSQWSTHHLSHTVYIMSAPRKRRFCIHPKLDLSGLCFISFHTATWPNKHTLSIKHRSILRESILTILRSPNQMGETT